MITDTLYISYFDNFMIKQMEKLHVPFVKYIDYNTNNLLLLKIIFLQLYDISYYKLPKIYYYILINLIPYCNIYIKQNYNLDYNNKLNKILYIFTQLFLSYDIIFNNINNLVFWFLLPTIIYNYKQSLIREYHQNNLLDNLLYFNGVDKDISKEYLKKNKIYCYSNNVLLNLIILIFN